eukprot:1185304-Prorocentrum_minimum.AAC.3
MSLDTTVLLPQAPGASSQQLSGAGLADAVSYDCYGTQMATCSKQGIMIWHKSDVSGGWARSALLQVRCWKGGFGGCTQKTRCSAISGQLYMWDILQQCSQLLWIRV